MTLIFVKLVESPHSRRSHRRWDSHPSIVDSESASVLRRPANVTCLVQYLFLGGGFAKKTSQVLGPVNREELLQLLREYEVGDVSAFGATIRLLGLL